MLNKTLGPDGWVTTISRQIDITGITYSGTAADDPVTSYVANGVTYTVAYNGAGLIATITGSDGSLRAMTYNGNNQLTSDVTT